MSALLTAIERVTDSVTIESVKSVMIEIVIGSVLSEDAREVYPSRGESIHPRTSGPRGSWPSILGQMDRGSMHPGDTGMRRVHSTCILFSLVYNDCSNCCNAVSDF